MDKLTISLHDLNSLVKSVIDNELSSHYWIRTEMSDVRVNQNGHCYLEFIEKDRLGKNSIAKARGMIWANTFHLLKAFFEETTKQPFASGLKVLVQVSITFHELYGYSLTVQDIDPSYTLGDQAINRAAIVKQLEEEGVLEMNKELELPIPTNRIAIISSPTAAGYEDFCDQLANNTYGYAFYTKLFPAIMQGDRTEDSIIYALEQIYAHQELFDAVVIIRGGGATSELSSFDSYMLAASCAQFPIPIITGIGHERDETVLDMVAHTRAKTPTAVAEFLVDNMNKYMEELLSIQLSIVTSTRLRLQEETVRLNTYELQNAYILKDWSKQQANFLYLAKSTLEKSASRVKKEEELTLNSIKERLVTNTIRLSKSESVRIENIERQVNLVSPENLLRKGYTFTIKEGKIVRRSSDLKKGEVISTIFSDGKIDSTIN